MVFNFCLHGIEDLPIPAGHFVLICNEAQGLPWQTGGNNQQKYSVTIGQIQDVGNIPDRPYMDFYLPPEEFILPKQNNIAMITTGPCVGIKEVVKTQHHGHVDSVDILDIAFILTVKYLEKAMAAVALGISNVFCHHQYLDNQVDAIHHQLPSFAPQPQGVLFLHKGLMHFQNVLGLGLFSSNNTCRKPYQNMARVKDCVVTTIKPYTFLKTFGYTCLRVLRYSCNTIS